MNYRVVITLETAVAATSHDDAMFEIRKEIEGFSLPFTVLAMGAIIDESDDDE